MKDEKVVKLPTSAGLRTLGEGSLILILYLFDLCAAVVEIAVKLGAKGLDWMWGYLALFFVVETLIYILGMSMVFFSSRQLGVKMRLWMLLIGWIPVVNIVVVSMVLSKTVPEFFYEMHKLRVDRKRAADKVCETKYPLVMVHGIFFRDFRYLNYWGRIPAELELNGATVYYGEQESAETVEKSAKKLYDRIRRLVEETGCEKVNIIAHSKGGLDTKYAMACLGMDKYVASITTVSTPHRGCEFAEYLLDSIEEPVQEKIATSYNTVLKKLGDQSPDFLMAVRDLTASRCSAISSMCDMFDYKGAGIYTQSFGSCMSRAGSGAFPLNMSYKLVKKFDGDNDGLVGEESFKWGEDYKFLRNAYKRGISHGDMIDLNRENIKGFDVREFYVDVVSGLKAKGL